jgi:hypothetical protein
MSILKYCSTTSAYSRQNDLICLTSNTPEVPCQAGAVRPSAAPRQMPSGEAPRQTIALGAPINPPHANCPEPARGGPRRRAMVKSTCRTPWIS